MIEIRVYGEIVPDDYQEYYPVAVSPGKIFDGLKAANGEDVLLRFNSPGGSADAGVAISNLLKEYSGDVIGRVDGIAASAATVVLAGCKERQIHDNAALMIHAASYLLFGSFNSHDFRDYAEQLDNYDSRIAATYAKKSDKEPEYFLTLMEKDTFLDAAECLELGLVDTVLEAESDDEIEVANSYRKRFEEATIPDCVAARLSFKDGAPKPPRTEKSALAKQIEAARKAREDKIAAEQSRRREAASRSRLLDLISPGV